MLTRRQFLKIGGGGAALILTSRFGFIAKSYAVPIPGGTLPPASIPQFVMPLQVPPAMPRAGTIPLPGNKSADYYEIAVRRFKQQILPASLPKTTVLAYGSARHAASFNYPGFTIEARWQTPVQIKWINDLMDAKGRYLPHFLPIDPTLHWANPGGGQLGRDTRPTFTATPGPYLGPVPITPHLHGGHSAEDSDGYPTAWFLPDAGNVPPGYVRTGSQWENFREKFKIRVGGPEWREGYSIYRYNNDQRATTLWYHDHTLGMTRINVYSGLAGFYNLRGGPDDSATDAASGTAGVLPGPAPAAGDPAGTKYYEIPILIQDRSFNTDGSLFYPDTRLFFDGFAGPYIGSQNPPSDISPIWNPEFFGNTMVVNGRTWPYLEVEPRRYRLRLLNGCNARFLILKLGKGTPFWQIGSEGGFLPAPVKLSQLLIAPAERADVIVDFTGMKPGTVLTMRNLGPDEPFGGGAPYVDFQPSDAATTGRVIQFRVTELTGTDASTPPERLVLPAIAPLAPPALTRQVSLNEMMSMLVPDPNNPNEMVGPMSAMLGTTMIDPATGMIVGRHRMWSDPVTEKPRRGTTETWEIYNFTEDAHPIHIHQVMFEVVNREVFDPLAGMPGTVTPPAAWEIGRKDTVVAYPGQITRLRAHFDLAGLYVWHCHIIEHEDNEMMRPMLIV